jgi:hypothetical protein
MFATSDGESPTAGLLGVRYTVPGSATSPICRTTDSRAAGGLSASSLSQAPDDSPAPRCELNAEPKPSRAADELCACARSTESSCSWRGQNLFGFGAVGRVRVNAATTCR